MLDLRKQYQDKIEELAAASRLLGQKGLTSSVGGNLSYRVSPEHILVTPTNVPKERMIPEYICIVNYNGDLVDAAEGFAPTSETPFHTMIIRSRQDVVSAVHAHCTALSAFAITQTPWLERPFFPEPMMEIGPIVTVPYVEPSSERLSREIEKMVHRSNGFLLQNHGALALSTVSPADAVEKLYMMESIATSIYMAINMGMPKMLTPEEVDQVACLQRTKGLCSEITPISESFQLV